MLSDFLKILLVQGRKTVRCMYVSRCVPFFSNGKTKGGSQRDFRDKAKAIKFQCSLKSIKVESSQRLFFFCLTSNIHSECSPEMIQSKYAFPAAVPI